MAPSQSGPHFFTIEYRSLSRPPLSFTFLNSRGRSRSSDFAATVPPGGTTIHSLSLLLVLKLPSESLMNRSLMGLYCSGCCFMRSTTDWWKFAPGGISRPPPMFGGKATYFQLPLVLSLSQKYSQRLIRGTYSNSRQSCQLPEATQRISICCGRK